MVAPHHGCWIIEVNNTPSGDNTVSHPRNMVSYRIIERFWFEYRRQLLTLVMKILWHEVF